MCGYAERANRNKKRFKCRSRSHQDHSDRGTSVNIVVKGTRKHQNRSVPALNSLPTVREVRRQESGTADALIVTHDAVQKHQTGGMVKASD
jgi:transposase